MRYAETAAKLAQYRQQIAELRNRMRELQQSVEPEKVADYEFSTAEGKVRLSELFREKQYLFVIHNMGAGCRYCTLWAEVSTGSCRTSKIAPDLWSPLRTNRQRSKNSRSGGVGAIVWCPITTPALPKAWGYRS